MMRSTILVAALLLGGCVTDLASPDAPLEVVAGTSFGMCVGYCTAVLEIDSTRVRLTESSRDSGRFPVRTRTRPIDPADWARLRRLADLEQLRDVEGVHGCPDCADGGAEWIELRAPGGAHRATFEFGRPPAAIRQLHTQIRELRSLFPEIPS